MSKNSEELRAEIAQTRGDMQQDVDAIADRVSPSHIAHRQSEKVKDSFRKVKDSVMGTGESTSDQLHHYGEDAAEAVRDAPHRVVEQTKGNPLAAGIIAFGAGLLASSLLPGTQKEAELVQRVKDKAEPLAEEAKDAAKQIAEDLREPARQAAEDLRDSAQESVQTVKSEANSEAEHLHSEAKDTAKDMGNGS
ncbi:DUF3618 domain-containing protein [Glutamicibacter sp. NPDC090743]|uniref:DUF3618 domain-containing protein n=1 Tax=Glutamicibacter sp. NPDC090743 TaxID=3364001 RepID=UPI0037FB8133